MRKTGTYIRRTLFPALLAAALLIAQIPAAEAKTYRVPTVKYPTIQSAINAARAGDIVQVGDGTYHENINFLGKAITVRSENGRDATIIDGSQPVDPSWASVVTFNGGEGNDSILDGFTVTGGTGNDIYGTSRPLGGGVYIEASSPLISNCTIEENHDVYLGGGFYTYEAAPTISNCIIKGNSSVRYPNGSGGLGGGMYADYYSIVTLSHSAITGNYAELGGGGVYFNFSHPSDGNTTMKNCIVAGNSAGLPGGPAPGKGGGLLINHSSVDIYNCTITDNSATTGPGGGIYSYYSSLQEYVNTIIYHNTPTIDQIYTEVASPVLSFCDVEGGWPIGNNSIDVPPGLSADYSLPVGSPCIDTGTDLSAKGIVDDFVGTPRPQGLAYDIGAFEHVEQVNSISITKALYDYVNDTLEVEAASGHAENAGLEFQGYGPMTWSAPIWTITVSEQVAPTSVTVCGPLDGCITQD